MEEKKQIEDKKDNLPKQEVEEERAPIFGGEFDVGFDMQGVIADIFGRY